MSLVLPIIDDSVRPIYLDRGCEIYCVVDLQDYEFAMQWKWKPIKSKGTKLKYYAFRTSRWEGRHVAYFLHKLICFRANGLPPTRDHLIGDHQDGDSLNNRRINLNWATQSQNRLNREGIATQQLQMAVITNDTGRRLVNGGGAI